MGNFEKIYGAAKKQDFLALKGAIGSNYIDEWKVGTYGFSAASQLALEEGDVAAVNFLMRHGANINYVALGAAQGGYRTFAEELLRRGASINYVARGAAQGGHQAYAEELLMRGANIDAVAMGAAQGGHQAYAEKLLTRGANINYVARGATIGGRQTYVEELLKRGANINTVAWGAAFAGHQEHAEELLRRGANIHDVAWGAAQGGHREHAEELLKRGANINTVAVGAALGGHRAYAEELLRRGASINYVARGAIQGRHISKEIKSQLYYLSFFGSDLIPKLIDELSHLDKPVKVDPDTQKRAIAMSKHMHNGLSYSLALTITDPQCQGMLYLLMKASMGIKPLLNVPLDVWLHIFEFVTPTKLTIEESKDLGFVMGRTYLGAQLSVYSSGRWPNHKERAKNFGEAIAHTNKKEELVELIDKQAGVLQGNNPYSWLERDKKYKSNTENTTVDKYHAIIGFWKKELTGVEVKFEEKKQPENKCYIQ